MTDNEIIKVMECCSMNKCDKCSIKYECRGNKIRATVIIAALNLINRQKAEIAELKSEISILTDANENLQDLYREEQAKVETAKQKVIDAFKKLNTAKSEAIREFVDNVKIAIKTRFWDGIEALNPHFNLMSMLIDDLVEEMTEGCDNGMP